MMQEIAIHSEIGRLEAVIIHTPGTEVEKMTPENAERALYSDILNLSVASQEYKQFSGVLSQYCHTFKVKELLIGALNNEQALHLFIKNLATLEANPALKTELQHIPIDILTQQLIEGIELKRDNLTRFLSEDRNSLKPLHNFFFTRDASMIIGTKVLIGEMASVVRKREALIMDTIFRFHPAFQVDVLNQSSETFEPFLETGSIEGGDVLVAREDILIIGTGVRTSTQGIDYLIEVFKREAKPIQHILVQELPKSPESFIHLDMVFGLLDMDTCMIYEPLIKGNNHFRTIHIQIEQGKVIEIKQVSNLPSALAKLGMPMNQISCGGSDEWNQEREQWHSGTNFLALAPGVIMGYERNVHTIEALSQNGYQILKATEIIENKLPFPESKTVITLAGSELARGGGGARCMSMPLRRSNVNWK